VVEHPTEATFAGMLESSSRRYAAGAKALFELPGVVFVDA
jgi:hypothetical protein